jgi:hypothetical protein
MASLGLHISFDKLWLFRDTSCISLMIITIASLSPDFAIKLRTVLYSLHFFYGGQLIFFVMFNGLSYSKNI